MACCLSGVRVGTANGHRSAAPEPDADQVRRCGVKRVRSRVWGCVRDLADARAVQAIAKHLQEAVHALLAFMQANFTG